mgnify:FL=1
MKQDYSWLEIAQMPQCCMCCGSRDINLKTNVCLSCGSDEGLWADERTDKEYEEEAWITVLFVNQK